MEKKPARKIKPEPRHDTTGMLFVRNTSERPLADGRRLVMVVGVLALPADADLPGEHQFVVAGTDLPDSIALTVFKNPRIDRTQEAYGEAIGSMILHPIWSNLLLAEKIPNHNYQYFCITT